MSSARKMKEMEEGLKAWQNLNTCAKRRCRNEQKEHDEAKATMVREGKLNTIQDTQKFMQSATSQSRNKCLISKCRPQVDAELNHIITYTRKDKCDKSAKDCQTLNKIANKAHQNKNDIVAYTEFQQKTFSIAMKNITKAFKKLSKHINK